MVWHTLYNSYPYTMYFKTLSFRKKKGVLSLKNEDALAVLNLLELHPRFEGQNGCM